MVSLCGACAAMNAQAFQQDIRTALRQTIRRYRKDGTIGMSADNLWQCVRIPERYGPTGANAAWVARHMFNEILTEHEFNRFIC